ncbi:hypothetical protein JB92DRAFT_242654 [Gautieria morchelliformis]|nr:hypothetical protein JB92DRAFT_242654 [Gautieria morchelliformis]
MLSCDIPHRTAIRSLIGKAWEHNFTELKKELAQSVGKISLTMDLWDDKSMRALDGRGELALHSALIGFLPMPGHHFGQDLVKGLLFITNRVNITDKIMFITMDGASNMAAMMQDFEHLLMARFIDFDSANQQIICFPHCLHVTVTAMLRECTSTEALENPTGEFDLTEDDPVNPSSQTPTQALQHDPVAITRNIANTIRSSQLHHEEFKEIVTTGNC